MAELGHSNLLHAQPFGLSQATMQKLVHIFSTQQKVQRVVIYGSRAKGNYREGSDIDLVLDAPDISFLEKLNLNTAISESNIPYLVDLSVLHELKHPGLLDHIERIGQVFYSRSR